MTLAVLSAVRKPQSSPLKKPKALGPATKDSVAAVQENLQSKELEPVEANSKADQPTLLGTNIIPASQSQVHPAEIIEVDTGRVVTANRGFSTPSLQMATKNMPVAEEALVTIKTGTVPVAPSPKGKETTVNHKALAAAAAAGTVAAVGSFGIVEASEIGPGFDPASFGGATLPQP
ncbi:hypothetical protein FRB93_013208 [Tulasnella sp. JGI-2019a]|nr:hypothetical protein FRB93_013208 [Tulasnella sp. JGI-2019a]